MSSLRPTKMKETVFTHFPTDNNYSFKHDIEKYNYKWYLH